MVRAMSLTRNSTTDSTSRWINESAKKADERFRTAREFQAALLLALHGKNVTATMTLKTPSTLHKLQTGEVYSVNLVWTVNTGP